ncbi:MAG TPA: GAF domain-containing protein, partial [Planctomycetaceae bacterium]|nr:GAF domain-containing protein [Planctomycetaceae bacterium]
MSQPSWQTWSTLPWLSRGAGGGLDAQLGLRLLESAIDAESTSSYLRQELPEVASEFSAPWVAVMQRGTEWERLGEFGRQPIETLPLQFLAEALDRDAAGSVSLESPTESAPGWNVCAAPVLKGGEAGILLVVCGRGLSSRPLVPLLTVARALGWGLEVTRRRDNAAERVQRLRATLQIASQLGAARETRPLLELIASEAARLLDADRSSIFIWDREHHEMVACPALGFEGNMLRLSDNAGIVGECLQTGEAVRVDDAYVDPRFNKDVDVRSGYKTKNLLCVPLHDAGGQRIGAFEVINKRHGSFTTDDEESLSELGLQAAVALANTRERESLVRRHKQLTEQVTQGVQIVGESPAIAALRTTISRLAATEL